jgi:RNA polymerase sigma-70 factor (ECF subfamily)
MESLANLSEKELVARAKTDFAAFSLLYRKYFPKIYTYIFNMLRQHEAAEDVVSITFEKALQKLPSYQDRGYAFGAWLYKIARNTALDHIKAQQKLTPLPDFPVIEVSQDFQDSLDVQVDIEIVLAELQNLELAEREVVSLRYISGYSIEETAKILGKSNDSIKSSAKRALQKLRSALVKKKK